MNFTKEAENKNPAEYLCLILNIQMTYC